jgi:hypothetical protein
MMPVSRQAQHRGDGVAVYPADPSQTELPKWMAAIDRFTPIKVLGLGLAPSAANLKNAPLTLAAAASISSAGVHQPNRHRSR